MEARDAGSAPFLLLALLLVLAGAAIGLGVDRLRIVEASYRSADLAVTESPASYRVWLDETVAAGGDVAGRIAGRLATMRIDRRQDLVAAIAAGSLWQVLPVAEEDRQRLLALQRDGILGALRRVPAAADLWLAAAVLTTATEGFNGDAERQLANSYLFAPLTPPVVRPRIFFAAGLYPLLSERLRASFAEDVAAARRSMPNFFQRVQPALPDELRAEAGAS